jgi:hypothetical protein
MFERKPTISGRSAYLFKVMVEVMVEAMVMVGYDTAMAMDNG